MPIYLPRISTWCCSLWRTLRLTCIARSLFASGFLAIFSFWLWYRKVFCVRVWATVLLSVCPHYFPVFYYAHHTPVLTHYPPVTASHHRTLYVCVWFCWPSLPQYMLLTQFTLVHVVSGWYALNHGDARCLTVYDDDTQPPFPPLPFRCEYYSSSRISFGTPQMSVCRINKGTGVPFPETFRYGAFIYQGVSGGACAIGC